MELDDYDYLTKPMPIVIDFNQIEINYIVGRDTRDKFFEDFLSQDSTEIMKLAGIEK